MPRFVTWFPVLAVLAALAPRDRPAAARSPIVPLEVRQAQLRRALEDFGLALSGDQLTVGPRGRRDLVLFSGRPMDATVAALKDAYRGSRILTHGYRVAGWAHLVATGGYTFTLKDMNEGSWVIELTDAGIGSRIVIWGLGREWVPERRPLVLLPVRLVDPE